MDVDPVGFKAGNEGGRAKVRLETERPIGLDTPGPTPADCVERAIYLDVDIAI